MGYRGDDLFNACGCGGGMVGVDLEQSTVNLGPEATLLSVMGAIQM